MGYNDMLVANGVKHLHRWNVDASDEDSEILRDILLANDHQEEEDCVDQTPEN